MTQHSLYCAQGPTHLKHMEVREEVIGTLGAVVTGSCELLRRRSLRWVVFLGLSHV